MIDKKPKSQNKCIAFEIQNRIAVGLVCCLVVQHCHGRRSSTPRPSSNWLAGWSKPGVIQGRPTCWPGSFCAFLILPKPTGLAILLFPRFSELQNKLESATLDGIREELEEAFLELYAHLHMNEAPYTTEERRQMDRAGGYWNHAGGLSPILKAGPWISQSGRHGECGFRRRQRTSRVSSCRCSTRTPRPFRSRSRRA